MNVFDLIGQAARSENVYCVLIGGFALHFYGVDRQTVDVDFLVSPDAFAKLEGHLTRGGYRLGEKSDLFARFFPSEKPKLTVDFLFSNSETVEKIRAEGKIVDISGQEFVVPSVRHLVALKLHAIGQNPARKLGDLGARATSPIRLQIWLLAYVFAKNFLRIFKIRRQFLASTRLSIQIFARKH